MNAYINYQQRIIMATYSVDAQAAVEQEGPAIQAPVQTLSRIRTKGAGTVQVVEFILGNELFAIDLFDTREVITQTEVTPLPNTPPYLRGIIDLRGMITTIIDLKDLMHITTEASGKKKSRIIVLDRSITEKPIGILVDDVFSVTTYGQEDIDKENTSSQKTHRDIIGVIRKKTKSVGEKDKNGLVVWLDIRTMIEKIAADL
ncbi:chemotaxis protein CheW [Methanospirillum purgamenti]|jgi:purine-binding chemotaxis protein CheW|uniref:Chemotaxis protein CheW n=2 Tax=Methanospirillum TaxID=2202 RepID=A0A8F5VKC7_METHU|nr:chemotaxis protein CheW [Methanospirillum hungatei]NLW75868.1 purine-binding chemotaxis protein CheW [Methanomicrobiales archaeon]QXO93641.1 chemotaxis protein CheW [Methanospirillum hungatei]